MLKSPTKEEEVIKNLASLINLDIEPPGFEEEVKEQFGERPELK